MQSFRILLLPLALVACDDGAAGAKGAAGADGAPGEAGSPGEDGAPGEDGENGEDGDVGPDGDNGQGFDHSFTGEVMGAAGAWPGAVVSAHLLDQNGAVDIDLGGTIADDAGAFTLTLGSYGAPSTQLLFRATSQDGTLEALVTADDLLITPATTAVSELVGWIVWSEGGAAPSDYTVDEVAALVDLADAALVTAGTDQSDPDAVRDQVLTDVGAAIADASEGSVGATEPPALVTADPPDVESSYTSSYAYLTDGGGGYWDIYYYYGYINDGGNNPYNQMGYLWIDGTRWYGTTSGAVLQDDVEWVVNSNSTYSGLTVQRRIHVDETESYLRYAEHLTNDTTADITVDVQLTGSFGSSSVGVSATSSGDAVLDAADTWFSYDNASYTHAAVAAPMATLAVSSGSFTADWTVTVPAGQTVLVPHWHMQSDVSADALTDQLLSDFTADGAPVNAGYTTGLSLAEADASIVAFEGANVQGSAGAVAPYAEVTIEHSTAATSVTGTAAQDGSFLLYLDAAAGETLTLTSSDGSTATITVL